MMILRIFSPLVIGLLMVTNALGFDLQGHRGARGLMPENTLPAFAKALSIGVSTLELDVGVSKDGTVVISHNPKLEGDLARGPDGEWLSSHPLIKDLTFDELQKFDLGRLKPGSRTAKRFSAQQSVDGTRMPSLAQLFDLVKKSGNAEVRFNIETKINPLKPDDTADPEAFVSALLETVQKYDFHKRVSIQSFDWRTLQIVEKTAPEIETVYLSAQQAWLNNIEGNQGKWTAGFDVSKFEGSVAKMVKAAGGEVWSPFFGDINAKSIKAAQGEGVKVIPWTVNDEPAMKQLIEWGVDGLITDYPDKLRKVLQEQGIQVPAATPVTP